MTIRKKSKEELQNQAEGFLDYADKTGKITEKQKERISKILGINESDKKGFFDRLSKRVGNWIYDEEKIGKKLTQGNLLHRGLEKYIGKKHYFGIYGGYGYSELYKDIDDKGYIRNFEYLWKEYHYYLIFKKYFEKYKTSSDIVNYKFIEHLSSRSSDVDYYKERQNDYSYYNDRNHYKKEFLKKSEKYKIFKENFEILMNSGVHQQVDWIAAVEEDDGWIFYRMDKILDEANPDNLKIFLDKYPNIDIKTLIYYFDDSFFKEAKNENLSILFHKFPKIDVEVLYDYKVGLKNKLKDSDFKNYIIKLIDFYPDITLDEFLWVCKNISIEKLLLCNNMDDFLELICKKYDFKFDNYKTVFNHYNCLFTDKIKREGYYYSSTDLENFLEKENTESIKIILNKYPNIELENLIIFSAANPESLKLIFEKYPKITVDELKLLENRDENKSVHVLSGSHPEILKLIFEKYPEITIDELKLLENRDENKCVSVLSWSNPKILRLIFEKYPEITIEELKLLENAGGNKGVSVLSGSNPKSLKLIFEKYPEITVDELKLLENIDENKYVKVFSWSNPEILKLIFEKYPEITVDELVLLESRNNQNRYYQSSPESLELLFKYFEPLDLTELIESKALTFQGALPKDMAFKEDNHKGYLKDLVEIANMGYSGSKKNDMMKKLCSLTFPQAKNYIEIFKIFDKSISMDIQRIKDELIEEVLNADNPKDIANQINGIFERNNLPLIGKVFKVFELLYPKEKLDDKLRPDSGDGTLGSPVLNGFREGGKLKEGRGIYDLIYKDLMNIAINSGDRSLREYLKTFIGSEQLLRNFETIINEEGFDLNDSKCLEGKFDEEKQAQLLYLFRRISVLYNRYYGKEIYEDGSIESLNAGESTVTDDQLVKYYNDIKKGFYLKKGELIFDRLQRFLHGLGYKSFQEVLNKMDESKRQAHERGLKLYNEAVGGVIKFPNHTFLKGVDEYAFSKIINRGITSREYLGGGEDGKGSWTEGGSGADSDATPFDIDGLYIDKCVNRTGYGLVNLIVDTDRGNFVNTNIDDNPNGLAGCQENQYELFKTGGGAHYGIRTGIPTTEVDYIIYNGSFDKTKESTIKSGEEELEKITKFSDFQNLCYEIARNGYYIPIVDREGNIKFTPEMYHKIRAGFNYMEYYDGYDVELKHGKYVSKNSDNTVNKTYNGDNEKIQDNELGELIAENSPKNEKYQKFAKENRELAESTIGWIKKILYDECGIIFNSKFDSSITGAELHDSGSTGRGTDIPTKDVDLDFTLLLDIDDYDKKLELIKNTIYRVTGTEDISKGGPRTDSGGRELGYQIKSQRNTLGLSDERPNGIPLDLLILKKSQVIDYSSSDAMKEKLDFIASNPKTGEEDLNRVRTNVIIMKKLLKAKGCYKKPEGGISGIGVENRIIQNHGNFIEALESFEKVAYGGEYEEGKAPKPLSEFQKLYSIYDAGENYKDGCNDNFVYKLNEHGYNGMLQIVQALRTKGIDGIREMIKEYETKKSEFIE